MTDDHDDPSFTGRHPRPTERSGAASGVSLNKLMEELAAIGVTQHDAETRFRMPAAGGSADMGLDVLDKLDHAFRGGEAR